MQLDDDIRSVVSESDGIRSQTSDATTNEGMTGKASIRAFLAEQPQFSVLCEIALAKMERPRFVANMGRLLKSFHICLAKEAKSEAEKAVAELLRSKRCRRRIGEQLAALIDMEPEEARGFDQNDPEIPQWRRLGVENWLSQVAKKPSVAQTLEPAVEQQEIQDQGEEGDSTEMDLEDTDEPYSFPLTSELKGFLLTTKAFQNLQLRFTLMFVLAELGDMLQSIPKKHVWISQKQDESISNQFKCMVENTTKVRWNWWPLSPRKRMLNPGESRLFWQCVGTCYCRVWREATETKGV
ncbi:hypothetical protein V8C42DRAFT_132898 [Trichoderma barbatum]